MKSNYSSCLYLAVAQRLRSPAIDENRYFFMFNPKFGEIAFYSPMMFQPIAVSRRSYRHVSICSHQLFVIGLRPIHFCSFVHRTLQNCMHRIQMHREWIRRAHGLLPLEVARYVLFLPDFEHEATAQNEIEKQRENTTLY